MSRTHEARYVQAADGAEGELAATANFSEFSILLAVWRQASLDGALSKYQPSSIAVQSNYYL